MFWQAPSNNLAKKYVVLFNIEVSLEANLGKWLWEYNLYPVDKKQRELTESILLPNQDIIAQELLRMRENFDARIKRALKKQKYRPSTCRDDPSIANPANYPKGYCTLIRDGVWNDLMDNLGNPAMPGMRALRRFEKKGGVIKRKYLRWRNQDLKILII